MLNRWAIGWVMWMGCTTLAPLNPTDPSIGIPEDTDVDTDTDTGTDTDTDTGTDTEPPKPEPFRFIALGDGGEGNTTQYDVGAAVKKVCDELGCDAAVYLGDNFYDDGVESVDDPQWQEKFEKPYADLDFPFYAALGNHDNGGFGGAGFEFWRGDVQVEYAMSGRSDKFRMPARYYTIAPQDTAVMLMALDTNAMMFDNDLDEQGDFVDAELAATTRPISIAFGHHPYASNGKHGNAGKYEGLSGVPIVSGQDVKDFFDKHICGKVDVYLCGHDHNLQWIGDTEDCDTEFIVSGAAAKTTDLVGRGNITYYETDESAGFFWFEVTDEQLKGHVYDRTGKKLYEHTKTF